MACRYTAHLATFSKVLCCSVEVLCIFYAFSHRVLSGKQFLMTLLKIYGNQFIWIKSCHLCSTTCKIPGIIMYYFYFVFLLILFSFIVYLNRTDNVNYYPLILQVPS